MNSNPQTISQPQAWILACRPKTLLAAVSPVLVGAALAVADGLFKAIPSLAALAVSLLLQIAVNLANDYFDFKRGIDTEERLGPVRVTQSGLIPAEHVKRAMAGTLAGAAVCGLYLVIIGGWPILVLGIAAVISALIYSGGPFPLASHGLGDLFVFFFFGPVAVCGTYFVQALQLTQQGIWLSFPAGFLITAILVVNNLRDIVTDRQSGKKTLAVMLGEQGSRLEYLLLIGTAYLVPCLMVGQGLISPYALLSLLSLPAAYPVLKLVLSEKGTILNRALAGTARLTFLFCLLLSIGLLIN